MAGIIAVLVVAVGLLGWFAGRPIVQHIIEDRLYPLKYSGNVEKWAQEYGVDPYLVYAVILTESGFDPEAESSAGARGLMQMTEDTFDWIKSRIAPQEDISYAEMYDPDTAIRFGTYFVSICLQRYAEDVATAAAAYHSGWGTVDGLLAQGAPYTEDGSRLIDFPYKQMNHYVGKIEKNYEKYQEIYADAEGERDGEK